MSPKFVKSEYSPGGFGRELRALATTERALREELTDLAQNGGSIEAFKESLAQLSLGVEDWRNRFGAVVARERDLLNEDYSGPPTHIGNINRSRFYSSVTQYEKDALAILTTLLTDKHLGGSAKVEVIKSLSFVRLEALPALPEIRKCLLGSPGRSIKFWAANAVAQISPTGVAELLEILNDNSTSETRRAVIGALHDNTPEAKEALIKVFYADNDSEVRMGAALSLAKVVQENDCAPDERLVAIFTEARTYFQGTSGSSLMTRSNSWMEDVFIAALDKLKIQGEST